MLKKSNDYSRTGPISWRKSSENERDANEPNRPEDMARLKKWFAGVRKGKTPKA
jgi:hypothetical protein